jgi:hypothetical protein
MNSFGVPHLILAGILTCSAWSAEVQSHGAQEALEERGNKPNVLMIVVDDMNDWVGCLGGHPDIQTPMRQSLRDMPSTLYRKRYPALKQLDAYYGAPGEPALAGEDFKGVPPENNVVTRNVCVGGKWLDVSWFAQEDHMKIEDNWVGRDPGFKSEGKKTVRDFSLENDSAVFQTGFRAIPVQKKWGCARMSIVRDRFF